MARCEKGKCGPLDGNECQPGRRSVTVTVLRVIKMMATRDNMCGLRKETVHTASFTEILVVPTFRKHLMHMGSPRHILSTAR